MSFKTPILLITWRRPDTTRLVLESLRELKPTYLYVASDGPNSDRLGESNLVSKTRELIDHFVDWPCSIFKFYSQTNNGCRTGVSSAINWFFDHVEEGIILEDDCVPHPAFYSYCSELLQYYRHDTRVWCISGSNFQNGIWRGDGTYYFSRYMHCWGWASWRRCWKNYNVNLTNYDAFCSSGSVTNVFETSVERSYWSRIWESLVKHGVPDTWDYQWCFTCLSNSGLVILPNFNLVQNIGFGVDATHTQNMSIDTSLPTDIPPLRHPSFVLRDSLADSYTFNHHYGGRFRKFPLSFFSLPTRIFRLLQRFIRNLIHKL